MLVKLLALRVALTVMAIDPAAVPALDPTAVFALFTAFKTHAWLLGGALVTNLLLAFAKQGWFSTWLALKIPSRYLPFIATGLGVLGTMAAEVIAGGGWQKALADGLGAAMGAVFGHQAIVEAARDGKELVPPTRALVVAGSMRPPPFDPKSGE